MDWWFTPLGRLVDSRLRELMARPLGSEVLAGGVSSDLGWTDLIHDFVAEDEE